MKKQSLKETILSIAKREILIQHDESKIPVATSVSKIGGTPDVPQNFIWPEYKLMDFCDDEEESIPLSFLAQINLKDIADYDEGNILPHTGVLSFFYELETMCWGMDPSDRGSAKVFYFPDEAELIPAESPESLSEDLRLPELGVTFRTHISFPVYEELSEKGIECDKEIYDLILESLEWECDELGKKTKLIGYPDTIQEPMELQCEIVTRGYRYEEYMKLNECERAEFCETANEWILLFQMGTISANGYSFMFGDCGHIYFWVKESDLKNEKFDDIWLILQCG